MKDKMTGEILPLSHSTWFVDLELVDEDEGQHEQQAEVWRTKCCYSSDPLGKTQHQLPPTTNHRNLPRTVRTVGSCSAASLQQ